MPTDGNSLFYALSDQLTHLGTTPKTASELRFNAEFLHSNQVTPEGVHFQEFIAHHG